MASLTNIDSSGIRAIQDSTEFDFSSHPAKKGLGPLGQGFKRGLMGHAVLAVTPAGLPLGLLWRAVAPRVEFLMTEQVAITVQAEPEGFIADDGWYVLITLAVGVLAAVLIWAIR